jgi:hypothetical protein
MDRQEIRERVIDYLDRDDIDDRVNDWINDVRRDIALKFNFNYLYTDAWALTSAGSARYPLPTDYLGHLTLLVNDKKLMKVGAREFDELEGTQVDVTEVTPYLTYSEGTVNDDSEGEPDYYIDRGMEFDLYPIPAAEYTMTMRYYAQPAIWSSDSDEDYISRFHFETIIWGTCLRGAMFLEEDTRIVIYADAYKTSVDEMIKREQEQFKKPQDNFSRMKTWKDMDLTTLKRKVKVVI